MVLSQSPKEQYAPHISSPKDVTTNNEMLLGVHRNVFEKLPSPEDRTGSQ